METLNPPFVALLPFPGMEEYLADELKERFGYKGALKSIKTGETKKGECLQQAAGNRRCGSLILCDERIDSADWGKEGGAPYWASTVMFSPQVAHFSSIKEASSILRSIGRNWASCPVMLFRRTQLICDALPHINTKPRTFPVDISLTPMGLFMLLDEHTMLYSAETSSTLPCGRLTFAEDHINPPSRAYLKLQEALTMANVLLGAPLPKAGDMCLDAGASPGGWTWVLAKLGCNVLAIDRSPLAPPLSNHPLIKFVSHDAFTIPPDEACAMAKKESIAFSKYTAQDSGRAISYEYVAQSGERGYDWVFSDVACYPERLLQWIKRWIDSGLAKNIIATIKVQGKVDYALIAEFAALPFSRVLHLNANKHELSFLYRQKASLLLRESSSKVANPPDAPNVTP